MVTDWRLKISSVWGAAWLISNLQISSLYPYFFLQPCRQQIHKVVGPLDGFIVQLCLKPGLVGLCTLLIDRCLILRTGSIALQHLDDVIAEVGFDRLADLIHRQAERSICKGCNHLRLAKPAEVATIGGAAWIVAVLGGQCGEVFAILQPLTQLVG